MGEVRLTGRLICRSSDESELVLRFLQEHLSLTRSEPGCLSFEVVPTDDPLVWQVDERFSSEDAFRRHQTRASESEWGRMTSGIPRDYTVLGIDD